jgi:hypothetical protein
MQPVLSCQRRAPCSRRAAKQHYDSRPCRLYGCVENLCAAVMGVTDRLQQLG